MPSRPHRPRSEACRARGSSSSLICREIETRSRKWPDDDVVLLRRAPSGGRRPRNRTNTRTKQAGASRGKQQESSQGPRETWPHDDAVDELTVLSLASVWRREASEGGRAGRQTWLRSQRRAGRGAAALRPASGPAATRGPKRGRKFEVRLCLLSVRLSHEQRPPRTSLRVSAAFSCTLGTVCMAAGGARGAGRRN